MKPSPILPNRIKTCPLGDFDMLKWNLTSKTFDSATQTSKLRKTTSRIFVFNLFAGFLARIFGIRKGGGTGRTDPAGPPGTDGRTRKALKNHMFLYFSLFFLIFSLFFLGFPKNSLFFLVFPYLFVVFLRISFVFLDYYFSYFFPEFPGLVPKFPGLVPIFLVQCQNFMV